MTSGEKLDSRIRETEYSIARLKHGISLINRAVSLDFTIRIYVKQSHPRKRELSPDQRIIIIIIIIITLYRYYFISFFQYNLPFHSLHNYFLIEIGYKFLFYLIYIS